MAVIKGRIRGFGRQLGPYLLSTEQNEWVKILEVDGDINANEQTLKDTLIDASLNEKLTKSKQGIYHCSVNPHEDDTAKLTDDDWREMAEIHAAALGFSDQRRVVVLQRNKQGRLHMHIAYERYDHEKTRMIPIDHNYRKQLKASKEMIQRFNLRAMSERNEKRPAIKETLTRLWQETTDAKGFIQQAKAHGYIISKGWDKTPYMVIDEGRSYKLFSHLKGIKRKEVRERLNGVVLMEEKEAIAFARTQQTITRKERQKVVEQPTAEETFFRKPKENTRPATKARAADTITI